MKKTKELKVGDEIYTWCKDERRPRQSKIVKIAVVVEMVSDDGKKSYGTAVILDSLYPQDLIADDVPTTEDELFLRLQEQAKHEVLVFENQRMLMIKKGLSFPQEEKDE